MISITIVVKLSRSIDPYLFKIKTFVEKNISSNSGILVVITISTFLGTIETSSVNAVFVVVQEIETNRISMVINILNHIFTNHLKLEFLKELSFGNTFILKNNAEYSKP